MKKFIGKDGYLYYGKMGEEISSPGSTKVGTWYKIKAIAATASITPENAVIGDVFKAIAAESLGDGDVLIPFEISLVGFVTDVPDSKTKEEIEVTTQSDEYKSYRAGKRVESSGTFNGYFTEGDPVVLEILSDFNVIVTVRDGRLVKNEVTSKIHHFFLSRNETKEVGETEIWEYKPCSLSQLTDDKPMDGAQPFNVNYKMVGSERPCTFIRKITA